MNRTLAKTITYQLGAFVLGIVVVFLVTGQLILSGLISAITAITHPIWYYLHERIYRKWWPH